MVRLLWAASVSVDVARHAGGGGAVCCGEIAITPAQRWPSGALACRCGCASMPSVLPCVAERLTLGVDSRRPDQSGIVDWFRFWIVGGCNRYVWLLR